MVFCWLWVVFLIFIMVVKRLMWFGWVGGVGFGGFVLRLMVNLCCMRSWFLRVWIFIV